MAFGSRARAIFCGVVGKVLFAVGGGGGACAGSGALKSGMLGRELLLRMPPFLPTDCDPPGGGGRALFFAGGNAGCGFLVMGGNFAELNCLEGPLLLFFGGGGGRFFLAGGGAGDGALLLLAFIGIPCRKQHKEDTK